MQNNDKVHQTIMAERSVLGSLLDNPSAYFEVLETLKAEHFIRPINQRIYEAMGSILSAGKKASLNLLVARIGDEYEEDGRDGLLTLNYLTALLRESQSGETVSPMDFVDIIVDAWRARALDETANWVKKELAKPGADSYDVLCAMKERVDGINLNSQAEPSVTLGQSVSAAVRSSLMANEQDQVPGCDTGLPTLDEIMGRAFPRDLGAIAAPQGGGKTVLAMQLARRWQYFDPVGFFQAEMDHERMSSRVLSSESGVGLKSIISGTYEFFDRENITEAERRLSEERIHIDDRPKLALEVIYERLMLWKHRYGIGSCFIDHLRLIRSRARFSNKFERMEHVTSECKSFAKELGITVVLLSQVTRQAQRRDDPSLHLSDLDGGGALEQDADWVIATVRRDEWLKDRKPHCNSYEEECGDKDFLSWLDKYNKAKGKCELTMIKNRNGARGEKREFIFNGPAFRIEELNG
ncbi:putative replicative DNA helicase [Roseibium sp. TrichSKD4]|uniref:replicative DNA helicase n=1 Tax=Roseibium sp. TrichSKD4 TaxID=744980 RepID=UPI0001E56B51|nr:replicative DNA helicase [Roseibium sp. TrichSKD4]EFO30125.1 putative replicative DNA helicase [Roseibium sp. TrichSKD4]